MIGAEAAQARLASPGDTLSRHFVGLDLRDQKYAVPLAGEGLTQKLFGAAIAVVSRRVDQRHPERNARAHRFFFNCWWVSTLSEMPRALPDRWDGVAVWESYGVGFGL
jgi:hypothetical protein